METGESQRVSGSSLWVERSLWAKKKKTTKKRKRSEVVGHPRNEIYYRNISNNSGDVIFLFIAAKVWYQLHLLKHFQKLSNLLLIFVLLCILSFLLDLIITSYSWTNSPKKLKQKEEPQKWVLVLRIVRSDSASYGSLLFSYRAILEIKKATKLRSSRFFRSDRMVRFGFQNLG